VELRGLRDPGLARAIAAHNPRSWALAALAALTLLRLGIAASVPLAPDEAYYWVWSRALAFGYPDHPPMVALWIRLGTFLVGDGALGIRLLGPLSVAVASVLLADAADRLLPGRPGLRAAALLNATLLFGVGSILMTPDTPLLVFWCACLWALARLRDGGDPRWWLAVGLFAGLAMASKYTAALLWLGIVLWLLICPQARAWLRQRWPWAGAAVALALFLPVVLWEAGHGWPSFVRQGSRVAEWHPALAARFLAELLFGQAGLATPLVFVLCVAGIVAAVRGAWRTRDPGWTLLAVMTVPSAALFIQHALGDRVQGNWPAVIYPAAVIAAAGLPAPVWKRLWAPAVLLGLAVTLMVYLQAGSTLVPLPARDDPIARQLDGWKTLAAAVEAARVRTGASFVVADPYGVAAKLARTLPPGVIVVGAEPRWALLHLPTARLVGQVGVLVQNAGRGVSLPDPPWQTSAAIGTAARRRGDETIEPFRLYAVVLRQDSADAVILPRPP
jgi:4-amino-4-deoxy-L-arabinose transferase-like glycosyltransferase